MTENEKRLIEENIEKLEYIIKKLICSFNIPKNEAEEYRQIAYLALCNKTNKYDGSTKFTTFANMVIKNAFIDVYRKEKLKKFDFISLEECFTEDDSGNGAGLIDFLSTDNNTEKEVLTKVRNDLVFRHINLAKENCTAKTTVQGFSALELKIKGYSGEEIARMFNVPSNSLRTWMSKARKILLSDKEFLKLFNT